MSLARLSRTPWLHVSSLACVVGAVDTRAVWCAWVSTQINKTNSEKKNRLIIHPFSQGSALNWSLDQYDELVTLLEDSAFEIVVSGTQKDA
jgi:ADP-heptose:LPS heptosyltransferase